MDQIKNLNQVNYDLKLQLEDLKLDKTRTEQEANETLEENIQDFKTQLLEKDRQIK